MPAYYRKTLTEFHKEDPKFVVQELTNKNVAEKFISIYSSALTTWSRDVPQLQTVACELIARHPGAASWNILLEFPIPRRLRRCDVVILAGEVVFVLELKSGIADSTAFNQAWDYALDLVDFHLPSKTLHVIPIVVGASTGSKAQEKDEPRVSAPIFASFGNLADTILKLLPKIGTNQPPLSAEEWDLGAYRPVPTIVQAAIAAFRGMDVSDIAASAAVEKDLETVVARVKRNIVWAKEHSKKVICFVTGVPGAGKTLVGLRITHDDEVSQVAGIPAHFMSGNGPLVKVLREALSRDRVAQKGETKRDAYRTVSALIRNIHEFAKEEYDAQQIDPTRRPEDCVVIFDEAQRAWDAERNQEKYERAISEPELILSVLNGHDWAVLVALVGGGQEINSGEAGLQEWGRSLSVYSDWHVFTSEEALNGGHATSFDSLRLGAGASLDSRTSIQSSLHLRVSARSIRSERVSEWVNLLISGKIADASACSGRSSFYVTRTLSRAKEWLRKTALGSERFGMVASSSGDRLRAYGIETSTQFHRAYPYQHWFLNGPQDCRSSFQMEVVATEFEIQGLELDYVLLCWAGDMQWDASWKPRTLTFTHWRPDAQPKAKWRPIKSDSDDFAFRLNAYRVLLTRARRGTVIWVPEGVDEDSSLSAIEFDSVANAILEAGAVSLD